MSLVSSFPYSDKDIKLIWWKLQSVEWKHKYGFIRLSSSHIWYSWEWTMTLLCRNWCTHVLSCYTIESCLFWHFCLILSKAFCGGEGRSLKDIGIYEPAFWLFCFSLFWLTSGLKGCLMASHVCELEGISPQESVTGMAVSGVPGTLPHSAPPASLLPIATPDYWESFVRASVTWCTVFSAWNASPPFCSSPYLTLCFSLKTQYETPVTLPHCQVSGSPLVSTYTQHLAQGTAIPLLHS